MTRPNLALIAGIFLACISLWFSATGLVHLFSGAGVGIILMAIGFEMAKISGVTWLIKNGKKKNLLSVGLVAATLLLTTVSSLGIYGYLGRAFASGRSTGIIASTAVTNLSSSIGTLESDKNRLYALIEAVPANQGTNRRRIQAQTQPKIDRIDVKLAILRDSLAVAQSKQATISNDIGDLRFAADLFGTTQEGLAKLIVTVLAFLLDPLAVMLILASGVKGKRVVEEQKVLSPEADSATTETGRLATRWNEAAMPKDEQIISLNRKDDSLVAAKKLSPALTKVLHRRKARSP